MTYNLDIRQISSAAELMQWANMHSADRFERALAEIRHYGAQSLATMRLRDEALSVNQ
jgi:hypothetical protein